MKVFGKKVNLKKYKKPALITLITLFIVVSIGGAIAYSKRDSLLISVVNKAISKAKTNYNLNVKINSYGFNGLSSVNFKAISIVPENKDSLAYFSNLTVAVKLFPLIFGDVKIANIELSDSKITLVKTDSLNSNYDFLFKKDTINKSEEKEKSDFADLANKLINQALDKIPEDLTIKNFNISYKEDTTFVKVLTKQARIVNHFLTSEIILNNNNAKWHVAGLVDPRDQKINLKLFADKQKLELPYIEKKYGLKLNFDTVTTVLKKAKKSGGDFYLDGSWSIKNLLINHPKISTNDVIVKNATIDANLVFGKNFVALDSLSQIKIGSAYANPYIKITLGEKKVYEMKLKVPEQGAQELFEAFPVGLFDSLDGIKVRGSLKYNFSFLLDEALPDSVKLFSSLTPNHQFKILQFGKTDLQKINKTFVYTPYEKGKPVRDIVVGPEGTNFVPLNQISPNLKNALLTAEDPSFFTHKGFVEEAFAQSIATNFKAKSFKRGGSTISMQLIKNIFLNRNKTLARKVEEILIVWLIENQQLSTKERMFEVYLNIIEWGRNIYGIKEAANYYFAKHPSELTLGESIYLANIVPKPKSSLYAWQSDGSLKPYLHGYFNLIGKLMAIKGLTARDSSAYGFYNVRLREDLRRQIAPTDTLAVDSLETDKSEDSYDDIYNIKKDSVTTSSSLLKRIFGPKEQQVDDTTKSAKELRKERRRRKREENTTIDL